MSAAFGGIIQRLCRISEENPEEFKVFGNTSYPQKDTLLLVWGKPIPDQSRKWMESWRKFCPDYEIIEWNENNYDVTKHSYMKEAYENKNGLWFLIMRD